MAWKIKPFVGNKSKGNRSLDLEQPTKDRVIEKSILGNTNTEMK